MERVGVVGAGTMGHGIAHVCALAGIRTTLTDRDDEALQRGLDAIRANLDKGVARGKVTEAQQRTALANLAGGTLEEATRDASLVVEAVPERLDLKQRVFADLQRLTPESCVLATNTSSLSVGTIAEALDDPGRVIGTHFFNPVHIMKLLEVVVSTHTRDEVLDQIRTLGERIGKEVIVVRDVPGFATSRLGICLGMEAIRMVEQGVASAADIDKAMVLGYRHPIGPLRLTDLVGLDVRMDIGAHLATELGDPSFEPPELLRELVAQGRLGKKSGRGFYKW